MRQRWKRWFFILSCGGETTIPLTIPNTTTTTTQKHNKKTNQTTKQKKDVRWTSGARFDVEAAAARAAADAERRLALRDDPSRPLVFLDVGIKGRRVGR